MHIARVCRERRSPIDFGMELVRKGFFRSTLTSLVARYSKGISPQKIDSGRNRQYGEMEGSLDVGLGWSTYSRLLGFSPNDAGAGENAMHVRDSNPKCMEFLDMELCSSNSIYQYCTRMSNGLWTSWPGSIPTWPASNHLSRSGTIKTLLRIEPMKMGQNVTSGETKRNCIQKRYISISTTSNDVKVFRLAQTGEGIKECELLQWFVKEGDTVHEFEPLCEVQSDKASLTISSPFSGKIRTLRHKPGDIVQVGEPLADILNHNNTQDELMHENPDDERDSVSISDHLKDEVGESKHELVTDRTRAPKMKDKQIHQLPKGALANDLQPSQILTSPAVRRLAREQGIDLSSVTGTGPAGRILKDDLLAFVSAKRSTSRKDLEKISKVAFQNGYVEIPQKEAMKQANAIEKLIGENGSSESIVVPLRGYRRVMVKTMDAVSSVPHFHFCDEVEMDSLNLVRDRVRNSPDLDGSRLTYMPFFVKAASLALRDFPMINSSLSHDKNAIVQHNHINIGIAIATPDGLVVPNIKNTLNKSIAEIAADLTSLQEAAAANRLKPEDFSGGTFTISNIGSIGGTYATPLVHGEEVAIMALGRIQILPRISHAETERKLPLSPVQYQKVSDVDSQKCSVWDMPQRGDENGAVSNAMEVGSDLSRKHEIHASFVPKRIMNMSLGADHRVVDGAMLAEFAQRWKALIEEPGQMLLRLR